VTFSFAIDFSLSSEAGIALPSFLSYDPLFPFPHHSLAVLFCPRSTPLGSVAVQVPLPFQAFSIFSQDSSQLLQRSITRTSRPPLDPRFFPGWLGKRKQKLVMILSPSPWSSRLFLLACGDDLADSPPFIVGRSSLPPMVNLFPLDFSSSDSAFFLRCDFLWSGEIDLAHSEP